MQADTRAVRAQLGVLSDARGLYTRLTARENIEYYAQLAQRAGSGSASERLAMMAELLDMGSLLERRVEGFSTGERLKVALARALIHDPHHLILDEPTNGLDVVSTRALRRLLLHLRNQGKCIVISSHIMQEVDQLADEIVIVARGRTVAHGTAQQIRAEAGTESLEDAFVKLAYEIRSGDRPMSTDVRRFSQGADGRAARPPHVADRAGDVDPRGPADAVSAVDLHFQRRRRRRKARDLRRQRCGSADA